MLPRNGLLQYIYIVYITVFKVSSWTIGPRGLLYDRRWMVVNEAGRCLRQTTIPRLCLITPVIDLDTQQLRLTCEGELPLHVHVPWQPLSA